jgi:hypothetical protein
VKAGGCAAPSLDAGACAPSNGNYGGTYGATGTDERPVTCVSSDEAASYCAWVGGRLALASEWMLAARGPSVQRYPWGEDPPTCAQRANLGNPFVCCGSDCGSDDAVRVGAHPAGDSPVGMSDVLMTPTEIVASDATPGPTGCHPPIRACLVMGLHAGAIDKVIPDTPKNPLLTSETDLRIASFRCVWKGTSR